jgi:hypothetical protein
MPKVQGIGRKKKKRKLAPAAPAKEVTPEKDDAPEVDDEAPDEHMLEMIEGLADLVLELVVEELIDVDEMVETQMTRLYKREVIATGCRESFESRFGRCGAWYWRKKNERRAWWDAWESSCEELEIFQKEWGIPPCDECAQLPAMCGCQVECLGCGEKHTRYAWAINHQCQSRSSPCSPYIGE